MTPESYDLAAAQNTLAAATTAAEKCAAELSALQARLSEKNQALALIRQRRFDGGELESDAPTIAMLTLDISGLPHRRGEGLLQKRVNPFT